MRKISFPELYGYTKINTDWIAPPEADAGISSKEAGGDVERLVLENSDARDSATPVVVQVNSSENTDSY